MTFARLVEGLMPHLIVVPILLPMVTAAVMLLLGDTRRPLKAIINVLSCVLGVGVAIALIYWVQRLGGPQAVGVYLPGNWPVPYGIVLVVDRLSAMMLLLTSVLGLGGGDKPAAAAPEAPAKGAQAQDAHADIDVAIVFNCAKAPLARQIDVRMFDAFAHLRSIDAQVATDQGQFKRTLNKATPVLRWGR